MPGSLKGDKRQGVGLRRRSEPIRRRGVRANAASASIGPVGNLFNSPSTASVLRLIAGEPARLFTLKDVMSAIGGNKGTLQVALRSLEKAQLVRREGRGPNTMYRYAAESAVGRAMLRVIEESRRSANPVETDIPWLAEVAARPGGRIVAFHGDRPEQEVGEDAVERMLLAAEPADDRAQGRTRPGFVTRA